MIKKINITLFLIILASLCLRLYQLGKETPSLDEFVTIFYSSFFINTHDIVTLTKYWFSGGHFPTYFLVMHYWMNMFGPGEFAVRLPSVIFGVLSIYCVFILGERLFNRKVGILASYLLATSTISIYYSQYAQPYNMGVFLVLVSFLFFLEALEKNSNLHWIAYGGTTLLALFVTASTLPVIICQILFYAFLCLKRKIGHSNKKKFLVTLACILTGYLPLLMRLFLPNIKNGKILFIAWLSKPTLQNIFDIFNLLGGKIIIDNMVYAPLLRWAGFTAFFAAVLVFLCLLGFIVAKRGPFIFLQEGDSAAVLLALWLSIPVILPLIVSYLWFPVFGEIRYALYITIPYYLLISVGIAYFHKSVRIMLIILLVMSNTLFLKQYYSVEKRADLKRVYGYIRKNIKEGETAAFITGNFKALAMLEYGLLKYYAGVPTIRIKIPQTFNDITTNRIPTIRIPKYESEIHLIQEYAPEELDYKGIWLIMWTPPGRVAVHQDIINDIKKKYGLTESISAKLSSSIAVTLHHFSIKQ